MNKITIAAYIVLLFVTIIHLYGTYKKNTEIRTLTKGILIPLLIIAYCCGVPDQNLYVVAAFFFCWVGDVLLMKRNTAFLAFGGVAFFLGHICFIAAYCRNISFSSLPYVIVIPLYLLIIGIVFINVRRLRNFIPKTLQPPMFGYLMGNATMNIFAIMQLMSMPRIETILIEVGAILFFTSDLLLFEVRFHKGETTYKKHTVEMLTYIFGEALLCYGMILLKM